MNFGWAVWSTFYITGAILIGIQAQGNDYDNSTSTDSPAYDYYSDYPEYRDRDYPSMDYYDDYREGRTFRDNDQNDDPDGKDKTGSNDGHMDDFTMKQLQSTIPGTPGVDYSVYQSVPDTSFRCENQRSPGFYGDVEAHCQVFHICQEDDRQDAFLCPIGTVFNQMRFICDWWFNFKCEDTPAYYQLNNQFHSPSGSTTMRDTMNKIRSGQSKKDMNMIISLARSHKKSMRNKMDDNSSHKVRNSMNYASRTHEIRNRMNDASFMRKMRNRMGDASFHKMRNKMDDSSSIHIKRNRMDDTSIRRMRHRIQEAIANRSMPPKVRNLFMLGMRMDKFGRIKNKNLSQNIAEDVVTTNTLPDTKTYVDNEVVKAMGSTGYIDVSMSEYITTTNATIDDNNFNAFSVSVNDSSTSTYTTENIRDDMPNTIDDPFRSFLNLSGLEMFINGSIITTVKLNHFGVSDADTTIDGTNFNIPGIEENIDPKDFNTIVKALKTSGNAQDETKSDNTEHVQVNTELEREQFNNQSIYTDLDTKTNQSYHEKQILIDFENATVSNSSESGEVQDTPTTRAPFNHENNFIIGNDTHISVSVTIHSKSGRSRLHWKRLPGIKRIRKILKNAMESSSNFGEHSMNETVFKRRNHEEKPKSRVMWIPAKKDTLERRADWRSFLESRTYNTIAKIDIEPVENISQSSTVENKVLQAINITKISAIDENRNEEINQEYLTNNTVTKDNFILDPNVNSFLENIETEFSLSNATEVSSPSSNDTFSQTEVTANNETEVYSNLLRGRNIEEENCTTICIKLLKSLHGNSSVDDMMNSTNFDKNTGNLTLFESLETARNSTFGRKSVLGASSEQWTVKYDPGPNCNENTDDDKVLIKGWSVIIDAGSVTKEKTVKRRGCTDTSNNDQIVIMSSFDPYSNEDDGNVIFNSEERHIAQNSKINEGSMDQRYWLNLVKNWLEHSQSTPRQGRDDVHNRQNQKKNSNPKRMPDGSSDSNNDHGNPDVTGSEYFPSRTKSSTFQYENSRLNLLPNRLTSRNVEMHGNQNLVFENNKNERTIRDQRSRFSIQNPKPDWTADLQSETSDWFQATQRKNWSNDETKGRDSSVERKRDRTSGAWTIDEEIPQKGSKRGSLPSSRSHQTHRSSSSRGTKGFRDLKAQTDFTSKRRHDVHPSSDEDYDDLPAKRSRTSSDWSSNKRDWSEEDQNDQDDWQSKSSRRTKDLLPDSKSKDWSLNKDRKDSGTVNEPKGKDWSKSGNRASDWSSDSQENRRNQNSRRKNQKPSWQPDEDRSDNSWKSKMTRNSQDEVGGSFERRGRTTNSKRDNKGRSLSDDWNWSSDKGYDDIWRMENTRQRPSQNSRPQRRQRDDDDDDDDWSNTKPKGAQDWSSMRPRNADWPDDKKHNRMEDDWASSKQKGKPNTSSSRSKDDNFGISSNKGQKSDWSSSEPDRWNKDTDSSWQQDDDWKNDQKGNKGSISRDNRDWNSGKDTGDRKGQGKHNPRDNDDWSRDNPRKKQKPSADRRDWPSRSPDDESDWSSGSRGGRNKGFTAPSSDKRNWSSQGSPAWKQDTKPDDVRSTKSSRDKGSMDSRKSNRKNIKGDPELRRPNIPRDGQKSWSSNDRNDWADDEAWADDYSWNRPSQKGAEDGFTKNKMSSPPWRSDEQDWPSGLNKGQDKPQDAQWPSRDTKQDSFGGTSDSDYSWTSRRKMVPDWSSESDFSQDRTSFTKGSNRNERPRGRSDSWSKGSSDVSWPSNRPDGKNTRSDSDSQKSKTKGNRESWQSQKGDARDSRMSQKPSSMKGDPRNMPKMPWTDNSQKNSSSSKGDAGMKKIVWSVQISTDGKTGNGWVPITLRPNLKGRENRSRSNVNNNKGSSFMNDDWSLKGTKDDDWSLKGMKDDDWSLKGMKGEDWKMEDSLSSEAPLALKLDIPTETNEFTSHVPESSFSHLFYIPATNSRYKRDYRRNTNEGLLTSNRFNRPYKIIKSGEILNDASKNNNFFVARADILVEDRRIPHKSENTVQFGLKRRLNQLIFEAPFQNTRSSNNYSSITNKKNSSQNILMKGIYRNWDAVPKESSVRERWSSPFYSSNFSASGWIPVTTFKPSNAHNFSELLSSPNHSNLSQTSKHIIGRSDSLDVNANTYELLNPVIIRNTSQEFHSNSTPKTFNVYLTEKGLSQNDVNETAPRNPHNGTEMKVGNETLRILSFSNIMKQFENEDTLSNSRHTDSQETTWNVPITSDPTKYSLKLINPSKENRDNTSNSWSFSSNENGTKQAWILTGRENIKRNPISSQNFSIGDSQRNLYEKTTEKYKIIVGNRTIVSNTNEKHLNSTLSVLDNKTTQSNNDTFRLKSRNWSGESEWKPVIRSIGKVVSFNRTRSVTDTSTAK